MMVSYTFNLLYRGVTEANVLISKITDTRTPQTQWSIDPCDGTGPTGYVLNVNRIQMIYLDYSWYGAGKIRFGLKDTNGEVRYVHEFIHNNQFLTAYFRTGNLPTRYEVLNVQNPQWVPPLLHWGTAVIMDGRYDDDKAYLFTASSSVLSYTNGDTITGVTNAVPSTAPITTYDPVLQTNVTAYSVGLGTSTYSTYLNIRPQTSITAANSSLPAGTKTTGAVQRDPNNVARILIDKLPTATASTTITIGDTTDLVPRIIPLVSIRLAPSVDTSLTGVTGVRELINRMQLRLRSVDLLTTNDTELRLILNGYLDNHNWIAATSPSLSQLIIHAKGDTVENGITIFSYRVPGGTTDSSGKRNTSVFSYDISGLGALGNSIMGGNSIYPNGPDVLTLAAVCLDTAGTAATTPYVLSARVSWAENQA